ncbi:MAG: ATP-binding protein [Lentisphaerae bacterium]|nr:ATP-binding protein [Lentisphaerota bacterium]
MNVIEINRRLSVGIAENEGLLPHVEDLKRVPFQFQVDFGLDRLPTEPGIIVIRGPRQYGKSTWIEQQLLLTVKDFGPGTAFYLNGDDIVDAHGLTESILELLSLFRRDAPVRRLFVDEITAVNDWQKGLKRLSDGGELRDVLVVTTGSKAADLRHGIERLPGRKGRLDRSAYLFGPLSYREFLRVCGDALGEHALDAYLLTGGSPIACAHIARGRLPEYVIEAVKDWIYGECAYTGRLRSSLLAVMECVIRHGGTPLGQAKLARDAGLANNTVAAGYVGLLSDLMCVSSSFAWDASRSVKIRRKPCKYHFCNTLAALAWHPATIRTVEDFVRLPSEAKAVWYEWAVAQELWRRAAIRGTEFPEEMSHWRSDEHELDFVLEANRFTEVKLGKTTPLEFAWFGRVFPKGRLLVVNQAVYETRNIRACTLADFLLQDDDGIWISES